MILKSTFRTLMYFFQSQRASKFSTIYENALGTIIDSK